MSKLYLNNHEDLDLLLDILKTKLNELYSNLAMQCHPGDVEYYRCRIMVLKEHIALLELEHKKS